MTNQTNRIMTYDPKKVTMSFGSHIVTGFADDSFITIEPHGDGITMQYGCDGEIARSATPDDTYSVKLTLLQTSESNSFLQEAYNRDRHTCDGMLPLLIKDLRGGVVFSAEYAWVLNSTSRTFGKEANNTEWEFNTGSVTPAE